LRSKQHAHCVGEITYIQHQALERVAVLQTARQSSATFGTECIMLIETFQSINQANRQTNTINEQNQG